MPRQAVLTLLLCLLLAAGAHAAGVPVPVAPVPGNPADRLAELPIEEPVYEGARRCTRARRPGMEELVRWLQANARGISWGTYRCERWGKNEASLHAEGRALDWHLDARRPGDAREARQLIGLLLAPDRLGNPHALARRMGIQEIIWDCGYWSARLSEFSPYRPCFSAKGRRRRNVSPTIAHRDHIHIGLTRAGAAGRTSFWTR